MFSIMADEAADVSNKENLLLSSAMSTLQRIFESSFLVSAIVEKKRNGSRSLRAILRESEAKLEMKNYNPPIIFCVEVGYLRGMNKNSHIWIGRCIVARVTGQTSLFLPKNSLSRSKNKRVWFSGA